MNRLIPALVLIISLTIACAPKGKTVVQSKKTECIQSKIEKFSKESCPSGANIKEYKFMKKQVFVLNHGSCGADMTTEVIDSDCKNLGFLGGISGNIQINGTDFSEAEFIKTIWEN